MSINPTVEFDTDSQRPGSRRNASAGRSTAHLWLARTSRSRGLEVKRWIVEINFCWGMVGVHTPPSYCFNPEFSVRDLIWSVPRFFFAANTYSFSPRLRPTSTFSRISHPRSRNYVAYTAPELQKRDTILARNGAFTLGVEVAMGCGSDGYKSAHNTCTNDNPKMDIPLYSN